MTTRWLLVPLALLGTGLAQAGTAEVRFERPEAYVDAGRGAQAEETRAALRSLLQDLAATRLPADQAIELTVTDIDLAGRIPPGGLAWLHDVRVIGRGVDWPRISLRWTLRQGDKLLSEGSEQVSDMGYQSRLPLLQASGPLAYEQPMISQWFTQRFAAGAAR